MNSAGTTLTACGVSRSGAEDFSATDPLRRVPVTTMEGVGSGAS